ncbi:MAG: hypothetical protein WBG29_00010, partial [Candidatus Acidiferrales bacterium]
MDAILTGFGMSGAVYRRQVRLSKKTQAGWFFPVREVRCRNSYGVPASWPVTIGSSAVATAPFLSA